MRHRARMRARKGEVISIVGLGLLAMAVLTSAAPRGPSSQDQYQEVAFTDTLEAGDNLAASAPVPTVESDQFHLTKGGIHWFAGPTVEYVLNGVPAQFEGAVNASVATLDGFIIPRQFAVNPGTTQVNPCTGQPNTISWLPGDGPGGVLAATLVCFSPKTKEIVGFQVAFDMDEPWAVLNPANIDNTKVDVQNVAVHEVGHVAGLNHVNAPKNRCLTMFPFSTLGEIQKRTPGLGDKLGLHELYDSPDVTAGVCGL